MTQALKVQNVEWHSEAIFELQVERNDWTFVPGDCMALYAPDGETSRPYSIASGTNENLFRFVIRRMPEGEVSSALASLKPGDTVPVSAPFGWFRPGASAGKSPFVFLATGTGIAPFLSYFRSYPESPPALLLYGVRQLADAVDLEWLRALANLKLCVSRETVPDAHRGRITDLLEDVPASGDFQYYLCGLDAMIDEASVWLENQGVEITQIHRECFFNASYGGD